MDKNFKESALDILKSDGQRLSKISKELDDLKDEMIDHGYLSAESKLRYFQLEKEIWSIKKRYQILEILSMVD